MASQVEKMREKAEGLIAQAEAAIQAGEIAKGRKMIEDAQALASEAKDAQDAIDQVKFLKGEFNRPTNDVPVVTAEREMDALNVKRSDGTYRSHTDSNYVPSGYIKGLSPAIQPVWVREKMGANLKAEADFYAETFKRWFGDRSVNASNFWRTANAAEIKAMQENTDNEGGYFVPEDYRANVIHNPGVPGGLHRPYCTVVTTGLKDGYFPTFGSMTWAAIAEEASYGDNTPTVGQVSFTVRKSGGTVKVSAELLEDAQANLPALLAQIASEAAGRYEDQQIIEGDGTTEPEGIRTSATDGPATAANNAVTVADFLNWYFDLPAQFRTNAAISTSSSFLGYLAGVGTTAAGVHLLSSLRENPEGPIAGKAVVAFDGTGWDNGAAIGASEELGCIGDWRNYYLIDRVGMSVTRDDSVYRANDQVGFFMRKRGDGRVGLADAFRIFKVKA